MNILSRATHCLLVVGIIFAIGTPNAKASVTPRKKILVLISSATAIPIASPSSTASVPVGFYLVELGKMLRDYEATSDFVFATPDGKRPTIDVNSLDLNSQIQGWTAPLEAMASDARDVHFYFHLGIRTALGIEESVSSIRASKPDQMFWREADIGAAIRHLGRLPVSAPLANSSVEAVAFRNELLPRFAKIQDKKFLSFSELLSSDDDSSSSLKLRDFDFIYIPGGHAPMVDFKNNPYLGEILNRVHDRNGLIVAVCHGPIALQAAQYRIGQNGKPYLDENFGLKGAKLTTVSSFEETLMMDVGYFHIPSFQPTRLTYFVDRALMDAGYQMEYGSPMFAGVQAAPGYPHIVYDADKNVLSSNGPQSVEMVVEKLKELSPP